MAGGYGCAARAPPSAPTRRRNDGRVLSRHTGTHGASCRIKRCGNPVLRKISAGLGTT